MKSIEEAFLKEGYTIIPFSFNGVGHPTMSATINNTSANFLLDTGAASNLIDLEFAKKLKIPLTATGQKGGGAGGLMYDIFSPGKLSLEIYGHQFSFDRFYSMDFSSIKQALIAKGVTEEIQGILGFGFFKMTNCFIDYHSNRLFIDTKANR